MAAERISIHTVAFFAAACCFLVYLRALGCEFVWFDDPEYVLMNQTIRSLDFQHLRSAFTSVHDSFWMPFTWISLAIDYHFWQLEPIGYHFTNIILHATNLYLVVLLADQLYQSIGSALAGGVTVSAGERLLVPLIAGLLFGLHPLRVESVAWITERKDVLNGLFVLGALLFYLRYVRNKEVGGGTIWPNYTLALLLFISSMLCKQVSVVLPVMLLVLDWFPLRRMTPGKTWQVFVEKVPFLGCALVMAVTTIMIAKRAGILISHDALPLTVRLVVAGNALFEYCRMTLYPVGIQPFYLLNHGIPVSFLIKASFAAAITVFACWSWRRRPWLTAGWLLFVLPLLPVLGFFQNGEQAYAARFTYLGSTLIWIFVVSLCFLKTSGGQGRVNRRTDVPLVAGAVCILLVFTGITLRLIPVWDNTGTLWSRVIAIDPLGRAYQERGLYRFNNGDAYGAAEDLSAAIDIARANNVFGFNLVAHRGMVFLALKRYGEAVADFNEAISQHPASRYYYNRGLALRGLGRIVEAEDDVRRAGADRGPVTWIE